MRNVTVALWLVVGGALLQLASLTTDFFSYDGEAQSAWMGLPTTSELILFSAMTAIVMVGLTAAARSPLRGTVTGRVVAAAGLIAAAQLSYRMIAPPFGAEVPSHVTIFGGSCMFWCIPSEAEPAALLPGMWVALAGCFAIAMGGYLHSRTQAAKETPARSWAAPVQAGMTPWLGLAALGAAGQLVFGFTFFTFYRTIGARGETTWSGWLPMPHTASWVFAATVAIVALVWLASKNRAPLRPFALGALIAGLAAISAARIGFRIFEPPFGPATNVEVTPGAYLALLAALLAVVAAIMQAISFRGRPVAVAAK